MGLFIDGVTEGQQLLAKILKDKKLVYFTAINKLYKEMALNWYLHLKSHVNCDDEAIIILCFDIESYNWLNSKQIECVYLDIRQTHTWNNVSIINNFFKIKHHVGKYVFGEHLSSNYNVEVVYLDVDMLVLRPVINYFYKILSKSKADTCAITNKSYSDIVSKASDCNYGGVCIYYTKNVFNKINSNSKYFNLDNIASLKDVKNKFGLNIIELSPFFFPSQKLWELSFFTNNFRKGCYIVHYDTHLNVNDKTPGLLTTIIDNKISLMKKNDHWLVKE
jgi:hypothetical protein